MQTKFLKFKTFVLLFLSGEILVFYFTDNMSSKSSVLAFVPLLNYKVFLQDSWIQSQKCMQVKMGNQVA